jgi:predicted dehydrogenase
VYIGTPHTFHYQPAKDAMKAGKHVLCEKPVTYDMEELEDLLKIAKENKVFFME